MIWGKANTQGNGNYLYYWLGSAYNAGRVWSVYGYDTDFDFSIFGDSRDYGVRPVIEISKSLIQ